LDFNGIYGLLKTLANMTSGRSLSMDVRTFEMFLLKITPPGDQGAKLARLLYQSGVVRGKSLMEALSHDD